ncbi:MULTISPECIES: ABC transporter ATP-binding protein [unclassified Janthinobacterium]|uniref:ABC transporter ATP-binding protein n=1 Tax=unclassified Janthinobacterium TaxID=2610881 RepID=UPI000347137E|nr:MULTISPECIES: ABC transporter ATP-binding protein [unclassified Janthinobacterium]MEC5163770.1 putative spermidine/putrescine transport system ATP-binding protein [Janthinobacterium sp. CG_S6]
MEPLSTSNSTSGGNGARDHLVEFRGVKKTYDGENLVVKHLDLNIERGEFLTLLGPSGSGKTTCLMMLAGFEFPTGGDIRLDGKLLNKVPPHKRDIGMVFQNYALFPHMTVGQNIAYPLQVRKVDAGARAEKVKRALDMVQMGKFADRYPAQLSGGQQQRIALARALVFDPKLVLMDEPLGALDKQLRERMQIELKDLHQRLGVTFVYVTHDQSEALTMSDRVAVFEHGVIQQLAAVETLYERPENQFVAGFIGDNNRFTGSVEARDGDACQLRLGDGTLLRGVNANALKVGDAAVACIRPERIRLLAPGAESANALPVTVSSLIYFGDHVRVRCALPRQDDCFIKLNLKDPALPGLSAGSPVRLDIDPAHLRVFI